ncbi:MAG: hypothetical protein ACKO4A_14485, partial [Gammaproteobacteria bacterium]
MPVTDLAAALFISTAAPESPFGSGAAVLGGDGEPTTAGTFASLLENQSADLKKVSELIDSNNLIPTLNGRLSPVSGEGGEPPDAQRLAPVVAASGMPGEAPAAVPAASEELPGEVPNPGALDLADNPTPALTLWSLAMPDGKDLPQGRQAGEADDAGDDPDPAQAGDHSLAITIPAAVPIDALRPIAAETVRWSRPESAPVSGVATTATGRESVPTPGEVAAATGPESVRIPGAAVGATGLTPSGAWESPSSVPAGSAEGDAAGGTAAWSAVPTDSAQGRTGAESRLYGQSTSRTP